MPLYLHKLWGRPLYGQAEAREGWAVCSVGQWREGRPPQTLSPDRGRQRHQDSLSRSFLRIWWLLHSLVPPVCWRSYKIELYTFTGWWTGNRPRWGHGSLTLQVSIQTTDILWGPGKSLTIKDCLRVVIIDKVAENKINEFLPSHRMLDIQYNPTQGRFHPQ